MVFAGDHGVTDRYVAGLGVPPAGDGADGAGVPARRRGGQRAGAGARRPGAGARPRRRRRPGRDAGRGGRAQGASRLGCHRPRGRADRRPRSRPRSPAGAGSPTRRSTPAPTCWSPVTWASATPPSPPTSSGRCSACVPRTWSGVAPASTTRPWRQACRRRRRHRPGRDRIGTTRSALLRVAGSADLAAATGFLVRAAERGRRCCWTGSSPETCALLAERLAPGVVGLVVRGPSVDRARPPARPGGARAVSDPRPGAAARRGQRCADRAAGAPHRAAPARRNGHPGRGHRVSSLGDGLRLATGTLTVLPVPPPRTVGSPVAGLAMALAPLVVLPLGAAAALVAWARGRHGGAAAAHRRAGGSGAGARVGVPPPGRAGRHRRRPRGPGRPRAPAGGDAPRGRRPGRRRGAGARAARPGVCAGGTVCRHTLPRRGRESRDPGAGLRTGSPTGPRRRAGERRRRDPVPPPLRRWSWPRWRWSPVSSTVARLAGWPSWRRGAGVGQRRSAASPGMSRCVRGRPAAYLVSQVVGGLGPRGIDM